MNVRHIVHELGENLQHHKDINNFVPLLEFACLETNT